MNFRKGVCGLCLDALLSDLALDVVLRDLTQPDSQTKLPSRSQLIDFGAKP